MLNLSVDQSGLPHLIWQKSNSDDVMYSQQSGTGGWSIPSNLSQSGHAHAPRMSIDHKDQLHLVWTEGVTTTGDVFYSFTTGNQAWSTPLNLSNSLAADSNSCVLVDLNNGVHVLWAGRTGLANNRDILYRGSPLAITSDGSVLSQVVTVPLTLTSPTLSFMYYFENSEAISGTGLSVQIDDGVMPIVLVTETISSQAGNTLGAIWLGGAVKP